MTYISKQLVLKSVILLRCRLYTVVHQTKLNELYLLSEKGLHSFIKCNPTMLGYEYARQTMDELGFDYMVLTITILKKIYNLKKQYRCYNVCNY